MSHWQSLAYAYGAPYAKGKLKQSPEDFRVDEILGFEPDGQGEHLCVRVQARGQNTAWLVKALAAWAQVSRQQVSFSGQKDRNAVTSQWFSIQLPGKPDPDASAFQCEGCEILQLGRHSRKIRTGTHWGNRFDITLREIEYANLGEDALLQRLALIARSGVPNYFGAQRFGRDEANLTRAFSAVSTGKLPRDRDERGWIFSALRSYLFNLWLSDRVRLNHWNRWLDGDILQRTGRRGFFVPELLDTELEARLESKEVVPAGILPGDGENPMQRGSLAHLQGIWAEHEGALAFLQKERVSLEVRSAVLFAESFEYDLEASDLRLKFILPKGSFATALVREIIYDVDALPAS